MRLSVHAPFWTRFITLFSASLPRVHLMCLRTEDQLCHPAVLSNMLQAEDLAILHLWEFLQSPLLLKTAKLMLEQYENSAPSNTDHHHHHRELLYLYTDPCIPDPSCTTAQEWDHFQVSLSDTLKVWNKTAVHNNIFRFYWPGQLNTMSLSTAT